MSPEANQIASTLGLKPLPLEGGFFRQTWCGDAGSAIFFLLTETDFSALHRLHTDELWHFYGGDAVDHVQLDSRSAQPSLCQTRLGSAVLSGETPQLLVPAKVWQGARLAPKSRSDRVGSVPSKGWSLLGCTLAPPWREQDFELGRRQELLSAFPAHPAIIQAMTR